MRATLTRSHATSGNASRAFRGSIPVENPWTRLSRYRNSLLLFGTTCSPQEPAAPFCVFRKSSVKPQCFMIGMENVGGNRDRQRSLANLAVSILEQDRYRSERLPTMLRTDVARLRTRQNSGLAYFSAKTDASLAFQSRSASVTANRLRRLSWRAGIERAVGAAAAPLRDHVRVDGAHEVRQALEDGAGRTVRRHACFCIRRVEFMRLAAGQVDDADPKVSLHEREVMSTSLARQTMASALMVIFPLAGKATFA